MRDGLSRRELVGVIGAGLAVSACTGKGDDAGRHGAGKRGPRNKETCGNEGLNPHGPPPQAWNTSKFASEYLALLCIELGENWSMMVNHANFYLPGGGEGQRLTRALAALNETWPDNTKPRKKFKTNSNFKPRNRKDNSIDDHSDFEKFRFNKPIELFVYIYQSKAKSVAPDGRLLSFGPFMQETDGNNIPLTATPNCSYFNARLVNLGAQKALDERGFMFRVENWSRDLSGSPVGATEVPHSMNIHFSIPVDAGGGKVIRMPMVFDPDTGNGTGNEP
jgi:hypothetical protein